MAICSAKININDRTVGRLGLLWNRMTPTRGARQASKFISELSKSGEVKVRVDHGLLTIEGDKNHFPRITTKTATKTAYAGCLKRAGIAEINFEKDVDLFQVKDMLDALSDSSIKGLEKLKTDGHGIENLNSFPLVWKDLSGFFPRRHASLSGYFRPSFFMKYAISLAVFDTIFLILGGPSPFVDDSASGFLKYGVGIVFGCVVGLFAASSISLSNLVVDYLNQIFNQSRWYFSCDNFNQFVSGFFTVERLSSPKIRSAVSIAAQIINDRSEEERVGALCELALRNHGLARAISFYMQLSEAGSLRLEAIIGRPYGHLEAHDGGRAAKH